MIVKIYLISTLVSTHSLNINDTELHKVWSMGDEETNQRQEIQNIWTNQVQSICKMDKKIEKQNQKKKEEKNQKKAIKVKNRKKEKEKEIVGKKVTTQIS